jgi:phenylalanine-4-hydroxylase
MDLRGDYGAMRADFTVDQTLATYSDADRETWRLLLARQQRLSDRHGCAAFVAGLERLPLDDGIPSFERVSATIEPRTGWRLVAVPGLVPDDVFFAHLAARRFPVTVWMRRRDELDYLVEPDLFHDLFGHVPLLTDPTYAAFLQAYGAAGQGASPAVLKRLARLYWYTVEFGLLRQGGALKAFGAGLLSSAAELVHAVTDARATRVVFDPRRIMATNYRIDRFQETYMVLDGFEALYRTVADAATLAAVDEPATIQPGVVVPGDRSVLVRELAA